MTNPLLSTWQTPFELPPFDLIEDAHFAPAAKAALSDARAAVAAIAESTEPASFANTIEALEHVDAPLNAVFGPFYTILGTCSTPAREALAREFAPQLSQFASDVSANAALFARIDAVWQARDTLTLTDEQARLLFLTRRRFVRSGAELTGADSDRLGAIMSRLSVLGTQFTQNMTNDENDWSMPLSPDDVAKLPTFLRDAVHGAGDERDTGPIVTLARAVVVPFLQYCPDRALRQRAYEAWLARGESAGARDNRPIVSEILALRHERAGLLGYESFAKFKLEAEMAGTPDAVRELLNKVWPPARACATEVQAALTEMLHTDGYAGPLEAWDWRYYDRIRNEQMLDFDESAVMPYFQLDQMIEAAFDCANRLFGLEFSPIDVPLWHSDCRAWEVTRDGAHVAVFIGDYFARQGKRSGAWCSAIRAQQKLAGDIRPLVVNVCNFAKSDPALLSYDAAQTLFHEFGHALHQMLSDVTYESLSGTSVARDFVELPSQLYEHWLDVPAVLDRFATHVETGAPLPQQMRDKLRAAANADAGFATVEYIASAFVDLEFHDAPPPADPMQRQAEILDQIGMPRAIRMRHATPHFAHVFSGDGYSSGYYSYMWSEVMDADAFDAFEEAGDPFDAATAQRLEEVILSRGGTQDAAELYQEFRGRMPGVDPLLRGRGFA